MIDIKTDSGSGFTGYLALPASKKGPGILLVQEIFGVNSHIRSVADLYAEAGYVVLAPDLFWRVKPGIEFGYTPEDVQKAMEVKQKIERDQMIEDCAAAIKTLRTLPEFGGNVGVVGYCMGGHMAYALAARGLVDCAVSYYGGRIDEFLQEAKDLSCPIIMHFGEKDSHITMPVVDKIRQATESKGHGKVYVYPDADHGFNCEQRASYDRKSAMLAFGRSMVLLAETLS